MNCGYTAKINKEIVDKWSSNIKEMMISEGRMRFKEFLLSRGLEDAIYTVTFWEKCHSLQIDLKKSARGSSSRANISNNITDIIAFADEYIDFYESQMEVLKQMENEFDASKISEILDKAKISALELLESVHKEFSAHLVKEYKKSICN